jgi:serine/threonine protein kinase
MVYQAQHVETQQEFAVKTIHIAKGSQASHEILKEIEILRVCRHDNIVTLYGSVHHDDSLWVRVAPKRYADLTPWVDYYGLLWVGISEGHHEVPQTAICGS